MLGYVVPTSLPPDAVGFRNAEGIVPLAVTSSPDFDDTPLWDEDRDGDYTTQWFAHWILAGPDARVPGKLALLAASDEPTEVLPPTAPGLSLYLGSPGLTVQLRDQAIRVLAPVPRIVADPTCNCDAAAAYAQVNASDPQRPMRSVYDMSRICRVTSASRSLWHRSDGRADAPIASRA